jgi:tetratricopeptide (TPR) repeat protein
MIDTAEAKALLQSNDINELRNASKEWVQYIDGSIATSSMDDAYKNQIMKLLLLVHSKLVQLTPRDDAANLAKSYYEIGNIWMLFGDPVKAIGQYTHSLQYDTNNCTTLIAAGDACCTTANFDTAIEYYEKAIAILISDTTSKEGIIETCTSYTKLALSYENKADFTKALTTLQLAVDLLSTSTDSHDSTEYQQLKSSIYYQIGTIQEKIGNYKDATISLGTAVDSMKTCYGDNHPKTQEAMYLLEMSTSLC